VKHFFDQTDFFHSLVIGKEIGCGLNLLWNEGD